MKSSAHRSFAGLVAGGLLALAMTSCSSSGSHAASSATTAGSSQATSAASSSNSTSVSSSGTGAAAALINQYLGEPQFAPTGLTPFSASGAAGKTVFVIPVSSSVPFNVDVDKYVTEALARFNVKTVYYSDTGESSQWVAGMNTAISEHVNAILLIGMDPAAVAPQIAQAKAAGIPTIVDHFLDVNHTNYAPYQNVAGIIGAPYNLAGRLEAAWAVENSGGKGTFLVVQSPDLLSSTDVAVGIQQETAQICPGCKLVDVNVPFNQWSTRLQTAVASAINANPDATYVLPVFDGMVQYAVPAITAAGKTSSVHIASYNADPFALQDIKDNNVVTMDLGESFSWLGYALADDTLRILTGNPPAPAQADITPVRVFTSANISATGNPPTINEGYGSAYQAGYLHVWGAS